MTADLTRILRAHRRQDDRTRISLALDMLRQNGMQRATFVHESTQAAGAVPPALFKILVALGRGDLSVARLFEGHVNALQLVARFGSTMQRTRADQTTGGGGLLGIWGADDFQRPGRISGRNSGNSWHLSGRKTYASGADIVKLALVAVKDMNGLTQLTLLDREHLHGRIDSDWWQPIGMQATNSYAVRLDDICLTSDDLVGPPGCYEAQPFFGAGAIRFVAAQLGGTLAVWDAVNEHLVRTRRYEDAHQAARLGQLVSELEAIYCVVRDAYARIAPAIAWQPAAAGDARAPLVADSARVAVEMAAERAMPLAMRSVGCAGLMDQHPLAAALRDLMVYLRQPGPDAAVVRLGTSAAADSYQPVFNEH